MRMQKKHSTMYKGYRFPLDQKRHVRKWKERFCSGIIQNIEFFECREQKIFQSLQALQKTSALEYCID